MIELCSCSNVTLGSCNRSRLAASERRTAPRKSSRSSLVSRTFLESADDAFIAAGIRLGRPGTAMGAYGKIRSGPLDDADIHALVGFLRARGPSSKPLPTGAS